MKINHHLLGLHVAIVLIGMTGLFGKFLSISPAAIICGRSIFAVLSIGVLVVFLRQRIALNNAKNAWLMLISGLALTLHWASFFHSVQLSTVAIGLVGFSTYPIFVTLLEPIFFAEHYKKMDLLTTILVVIGLWFVAPNLDFSEGDTVALMWAVLSGLLAAVLALINRQLVAQNHFFTITFYQQAVAFMLTAPVVWLLAYSPTSRELLLLALLGVVFTAVPQALLTRSLSFVNAQFISVMIGLEPVYAIIFAIVLLGEIPPVSTVIGGAFILLAVMLATRAHSQQQHSLAKNQVNSPS